MCFYSHCQLFQTSVTGARVGMGMSYFASSKAAGPTMPWESAKSYPAINGYTIYENVTFAHFDQKCGDKRSRAIMTNPWIGDIIHPMDVKGNSVASNVTSCVMGNSNIVNCGTIFLKSNNISKALFLDSIFPAKPNTNILAMVDNETESQVTLFGDTNRTHRNKMKRGHIHVREQG